MKTYTNHIYSDHECLPKTARDYQSTHYDPGEIQVCEEEETQADQENASINSGGLPPQFESIAA